MSINPLTHMATLPTVQRQFTRTDTGVSRSLSGTTAQGTEVAVEKSREKNADGGVSFSSAIKFGDSFSKTVEGTLTAEQVDARQNRLHELGVKLSENPVTGARGNVHDGSYLLRITA